MGQCISTATPEQRLALEASLRIDAENDRDFRAQRGVIRLLLLGAGESGKSTVFKQIRMLYGTAYTRDERLDFRRHIHQNMIETVWKLCGYIREHRPGDAVVQTAAFQRMLPPPEDAVGHQEFPELDVSILSDMRELWMSPDLAAVWATDRAGIRGGVIDTAAAFLDRMDEIASFDFLPSDADILLARVRTTGVREERFVIDKQEYQFFDVGGQRNERRKWIRCFEGVQGVIFMVGLSEYDQVLVEDDTTNRMVEAIELFAQICNEPSFTKSAMILFLNKKDLFQEKIKNVYIGSVSSFSDYSGSAGDYDSGVSYFLDKFTAKNYVHSQIFHHVTCATDTSSIKVVFNACTEVIIRISLEAGGFIS